MLYGFGTRRIFTPFMEPFVRQAGGKWHQFKDVEGNRYGKTHWYDFNLTDWLKEEEPGEPVVFGNLRGTADIIRAAEKHNIDYYYFDHAYVHKAHVHRASPIFKTRFYRITKNGEQLTKFVNWKQSPELIKRIEQFEKIQKVKINLNLYGKGSKILILPPTQFICEYHQLGTEDEWIDNTIQEIKKHTDREIVVRKKPPIGETSPIPFEEHLKQAFCVVTHQTSAVIEAIRYGIPVFCSEYSCAKPISKTDLSQIEHPYYPSEEVIRYWINSLLTAQFTEEEITGGKAKDIIDNTQ